MRYSSVQLQTLSKNLLMAAGTPDDIADKVSQIIVNSNLTGHDSHGILRIPKYLREIEMGTLKPSARPDIIHEKPGLLIVDGRHGFGHYTASQAMTWAIERAKKNDICAVSFRRMGHMGRMGEYVEMAAMAGCIGLILAGRAGDPGCSVVPFGGAKGALWPNPLTVGVPTGDDAPFVLDMATSTLAEGSLQVARSQNQPVPRGAIVDKNGAPTTDVADFYNGGFLLPFGGHKGYGIAILMTLLGGLSGNMDAQSGYMDGEFLQVINVDSFLPREEYEAGVRACLNRIRNTPPAPGIDEVLIPGDKARRAHADRIQHGIEIPEVVWNQIQSWGEKMGVDIEKIVEDTEQLRHLSL